MNNVTNTNYPMHCAFDINKGQTGYSESRREVKKQGHQGTIHELTSPGISLGYYNIQSERQGQVVFANQKPFIQCSYTISGIKSYTVDNGKQQLASFTGQDYNYLFLNSQEVCLNWQPEERLEIFELGISPELFLFYLPPHHPFYDSFQHSFSDNKPASLSRFNLPLPQNFCDILRQMLTCPMEGRYKELFIRSKTIELLAYQLEQYEQLTGTAQLTHDNQVLKEEDIERMYRAREIILLNLDSPCSLIDLAHQVGTNETYLKKHFKQVFNNTVFGLLQNAKMEQSKDLLLQGKSVAEVADRAGYKYPAHFARAFKKHFGYPPTKIRR